VDVLYISVISCLSTDV